MYNSYKKYFSLDSNIKAHTFKTWKQTIMLISNYCKKHNCSDEFKWQFIKIETFESQKNSEAKHKSPANSLDAVRDSTSDETINTLFTQNMFENQKDWLLNASPQNISQNTLQNTSQNNEPEPMNTSDLSLLHKSYSILEKHKILKN